MTQTRSEVIESTAPIDFDVLIIGAGFAGMYQLHELRRIGLTAHVFETGTDVGGTWYWNRYPGARCDVESLFYSYSFDADLEQEWEWTERYPAQAEILRYAQHVADRFDLRRDISFSTKVESAEWDDTTSTWTLHTDTGRVVRSRFLITAVGCLSASRIPDFPGLDSFTGPTYHTGRWPHEGVDFTGQRVAVIGTGSSGIQSIPVIAAEADHVTVFQRTPNFSIPAHNHPLDPAEQARVKANYPTLREAARHSPSGYVMATTGKQTAEVTPEHRQRDFDEAWARGGAGLVGVYVDTAIDEQANEVAADYVRQKIREIVADPELADLLSPHDHPIGTKRICVDTDYYATYNREDVTLVDIRHSPITAITPQGVQVGDDTYEVDAIVFATGYDAMTGPLNRIDIRGSRGQALKDAWYAGPRTYLGLTVAGFPNLLTITGPGSPSVLSNMIVSIEQHVDWITDLLGYAVDRSFVRIEAEESAQDSWVDHVNEVAAQTLYPKAASWYMGANIPGKPRVFMPYLGGVGAYRERCDEIAEAGYKGLLMS